jgi:hypothetical protein
MKARPEWPTASLDRVLALAFGLYQAVHIVVNGRYMFLEGAEAFPAPPGGWDDQSVEWARGTAIVDFIVAIASVAFVVGFLQRREWSIRLGLVTTSVFTAALAMFTIATHEVGALHASPWFYALIIVAALPGALLFARLASGAIHS